jgi:hypothetical protein
MGIAATQPATQNTVEIRGSYKWNSPPPDVIKIVSRESEEMLETSQMTKAKLWPYISAKRYHKIVSRTYFGSVTDFLPFPVIQV